MTGTLTLIFSQHYEHPRDRSSTFSNISGILFLISKKFYLCFFKIKISLKPVENFFFCPASSVMSNQSMFSWRSVYLCVLYGVI